MGELSVWHWLIAAFVFVLLFGARKLPEAARGLGRGLRIFRAEMRADDASSQVESAKPDAVDPSPRVAAPSTVDTASPSVTDGR